MAAAADMQQGALEVEGSLEGALEGKGAGAFDLERVLHSLQAMKSEIADIEDEDEKRKMAARVALGLIYGLEGVPVDTPVHRDTEEGGLKFGNLDRGTYITKCNDDGNDELQLAGALQSWDAWLSE
ncbi:hypothetical protein CVT26_000002 [Gymnopilus dilepis]|uniref:Uncharacterized protein n=1 Tax=Gymnopilus dilepis TaxID=231916 RepID=A0A409X5F4_9AGAR|nr:hypothetical protein CVT26_000002 [Gymnopilus dilepis]